VYSITYMSGSGRQRAVLSIDVDDYYEVRGCDWNQPLPFATYYRCKRRGDLHAYVLTNRVLRIDTIQH